MRYPETSIGESSSDGSTEFRIVKVLFIESGITTTFCFCIRNMKPSEQSNRSFMIDLLQKLRMHSSNASFLSSLPSRKRRTETESRRYYHPLEVKLLHSEICAKYSMRNERKHKRLNYLFRNRRGLPANGKAEACG